METFSNGGSEAVNDLAVTVEDGMAGVSAAEAFSRAGVGGTLLGLLLGLLLGMLGTAAALV